MAQEFNKMSKAELEAVMQSDDLTKMSRKDLNALKDAMKAAGLLSVQYDNMLGIVINNRMYEEIKNSNASAEEKALAFEMRNEYNQKLRANTENKLYTVEEIMSRAVLENGKYHFDELTKGEMDFLVAQKAVRVSDVVVDKNYKIGMEKNRDLSKENATTEQLSQDVQNSQAFWEKLNDNQQGVVYKTQPLTQNRLKVEATEKDKVLFTGIDNGNKGFDILKREDGVEPYEIYNLLVKKAKVTNPKAKIRIKENVKDPVARNKLLIACAKNNMEPVGNIPEGFDFAALKELVKDVKDVATINALAGQLYGVGDFDVVSTKEEENDRAAAAVFVNQGNTQQPAQEEKKEKKGNTVVAPVILGGKENKAAASANTKDEKEEKKVVAAPKRPWWKKVRDAVVVGGIALLGLVGIRNCQGNQKLEKNVKDLQEQVDNKSITDCDELGRLIDEKYNDGYMDGFADASKECNKKKVVTKTPVKKTPVKSIPGDTISMPYVVVRGYRYKVPDQDFTLAKLQPASQKPVVEEKDSDNENTKRVVSPWNAHGKYSADFRAHGKKYKNVNTQEESQTLDLSNPDDFNRVYEAVKDNKSKNKDKDKTISAWAWNNNSKGRA